VQYWDAIDAKPTNIAELKTAYRYGIIYHRSSLIGLRQWQSCHFESDSDRALLHLADTLKLVILHLCVIHYLL